MQIFLVKCVWMINGTSLFEIQKQYFIRIKYLLIVYLKKNYMMIKLGGQSEKFRAWKTWNLFLQNMLSRIISVLRAKLLNWCKEKELMGRSGEFKPQLVNFGHGNCQNVWCCIVLMGQNFLLLLQIWPFFFKSFCSSWSWHTFRLIQHIFN